jgi:hypothetical protein
MKIKGLLDPRLRGDDKYVSFRTGTNYAVPCKVGFIRAQAVVELPMAE